MPAYLHFDAGTEWTRLVERGLQFEFYDVPTQLSGVRGNCLEPLIIADRHLLKVRPVAPDEPLIDGGLYCIEWNNDAEIQAYREKIGAPRTERIVIAKFLRYLGGSWYAQFKDGHNELNGVVVGMVVGIVALSAAGCTPQQTVHARHPVCGNPFDPGSMQCSGLGVNAASQMVSTYTNFVGAVDTAAVSPNSQAGAATTFVSTGAPVSIDIACNYYYQTFGTYGSITISIYRDGAPLASGGTFNTGTLPGTTLSLPIPVAIIASDNPAAGSHTYTLQTEVTGPTGTGEIVAYVHDLYLKICEVKR